MATGLSLSSTSNLSTGQKILIASAKLAFEPEAPDPDLIENERIPNGHKQWDILTYARLSSAQILTEGVDLSMVEQLVTNTITITPTEFGLIVTLSKRLIARQGDTNIVATAGRQIAESVRRRMALRVIAIYDTLTKSIAGAATPLDITFFRGAVAYLLSDNSSSYGPAPVPLFASLHIEQISDIVADISDPGTVVSSRYGISEEMMQRWWKGQDRLYSVQIFNGGNITRDSSDDAKGAIFNKSFAHLVMQGDFDPTEEKDNSMRAIEYGGFQVWGEGLRADPFGVEVYSDAATTV